MLLGANLDARFWPYAFHHYIQLANAFPSRDQLQPPITLAHNRRENFTHLRTFGSRVWVRPSGRRPSKLFPNSRKEIFLGFLPDTTKNILWYDAETDKIKIASHVRFDEGMNDLPVASVPPNVQHLQRIRNNFPIPAYTAYTSLAEFTFTGNPFSQTLTKPLCVRCNHPTFGLRIALDVHNNRAFVSDILPRSSAAALFSTLKATKNKLKGAYVTAADDTVVFTEHDVYSVFRRLFDSSSKVFNITFAPEK